MSKLLSEMVSALIKEDTATATSLLSSYLAVRTKKFMNEDDSMVPMTAEEEEDAFGAAPDAALEDDVDESDDETHDEDTLALLFKDGEPSAEGDGNIRAVALDADDLDDVTLSELEALLNDENVDTEDADAELTDAATDPVDVALDDLEAEVEPAMKESLKRVSARRKKQFSK